jgi:hypothetical protein
VYDVTDNPAFDEGRERGTAWAKEALDADEADPRVVLAAERIELALGSARGDSAHGFLRGVRDVLVGLHPYERPNVIIEVARSASPASVVVRRRSVWQRIRGTAYGDED